MKDNTRHPDNDQPKHNPQLIPLDGDQLLHIFALKESLSQLLNRCMERIIAGTQTSVTLDMMEQELAKMQEEWKSSPEFKMNLKGGKPDETKADQP